MTAPTDPQIAAVVEGLSEVQRSKLLAIALPVNEYFRLDEGEHHAPYTALRKHGVLGRNFFGDMGALYFVTPFGAAVRAHLERQDDER